MQRVSKFIQRRWGSWGIFFLALWALVLTLVTLARLLRLSASGVASQGSPSQGQVWITFALYVLFSVGFAASAYGLWIRRHWGRLLFIGMIIVWASIYLIPLLIPNTSSTSSVYPVGELAFNTINTIAYLVGTIITVWYLNMPHIKALFDTHGRESANTLADTDEQIGK